MSKFAIYNKITGQIRQISTADDLSQISHLINDNFGYLIVNQNITDGTHYVDTASNTFVEFPAKPGVNYQWDWNTHEWQSLETIESVKNDKWREIKKSRSAAVAAPLVTNYGTFDAGFYSRSSIQNALKHVDILSAADPAATVKFTLSDNTEVDLNKDQLTEIVNGMIIRTEGVYATARNLRKQIADAQTTSEVKSISWPAA